MKFQSIKQAEQAGYKRCYPYRKIGNNKPRWYFNGSYFDKEEIIGENIPNYDNVRAALNSTKGRIFEVEFIKRSTGELRKMTARMKVTKYLKGGTQPYKPKEHNLITVFSMADKGYRNISVENIK